MTAITPHGGSIGQELVKRNGTAPTRLRATVVSTSTYAVHENRLAWAMIFFDGCAGAEGTRA